MKAKVPFSRTIAWGKLRTWALLALSIIGAPVVIAMHRVLPRRVREDMLSLIKPLEAGVRRLLLLEVLALPKPEKPMGAPRSKVARKSRRASPELSADSKDWRVSFRVLQTNSSAPAHKRGSRYIWAKQCTFDARPLARRFEAVTRVLKNPAPYIARLARRVAGDYRIDAPYARTNFRAAALLLRDIEDETRAALDALNQPELLPMGP